VRRKQGQGSALDPREAEPLDTVRLSKFLGEEGGVTAVFVQHTGLPPSSPKNRLTETEVQGLGPWRVWAEPSACFLRINH